MSRPRTKGDLIPVRLLESVDRRFRDLAAGERVSPGVLAARILARWTVERETSTAPEVGTTPRANGGSLSGLDTVQGVVQPGARRKRVEVEKVAEVNERHRMTREEALARIARPAGPKRLTD